MSWSGLAGVLGKVPGGGEGRTETHRRQLSVTETAHSLPFHPGKRHATALVIEDQSPITLVFCVQLNLFPDV